MKSDIHNFRLAIYKAGIKPPKEIDLEQELHLVEVANEYSSNTETGYYIYRDGKPSVGLYGCESMGISKNWSSKKIEQMTDSELRHYKKAMRELRTVRDNAMTSVSTGMDTKKDATIDEPIIKKSGQPKQVEVVHKMTHKESKWNDQAIRGDRVARRLLWNSIEVIGDRSKVKTLRLIALLNSDEDMPWYMYNKGKPIGSQHLWRILEKFDIHSTDIRFKSGVAKGFRTESFLQAWRRVLLL